MKKMEFLSLEFRGRAIFLLGIFAFIPLLSQSQDIDTGLILQYSCNNITSTTLSDDSGNNNDGTLQGSASSVVGFDENGVLCTLKADYITAPDNINVGLESFSFATWVKLSSLKNATRFFDWGSGTNGSNNFLAFILSYGKDDGLMTLRYRPSSGTAYNVESTSKCPVGVWAHIALTYHWNGTSGLATIYLNGEVVGSKSGLPYKPSTSLGNTTDNYFGFSRWTQDNNGFSGIFDEIRVYNRSLTKDDVIALAGLSELKAEYDQLDLGDLSAITSNISLPIMGTTYSDVSIDWSTTNETIVNIDGTVIRPSYFDYNITLKATLTRGLSTMVKTFPATIMAAEGTRFENDLLVRFDFSNSEGTTVVDVAEKQFVGTVKNVAKVVTVGVPETGVYNVLDLGSGNGYFDMGTEVGKVVSRLSDYSISVYYRIDDSYTSLGSDGNFIWNFSNSMDAVGEKNGYLIGSLKDQSISITPGYYAKASGNESVSFSRKALKGNWHHMAYIQNGTIGTIYIDGIPMISDVITNLPIHALTKDGMLGTPYNWIGRSCYSSDVYLRNTQIYDFRVYKKALTKDDILTNELDVVHNIANLERAYKAYIGDHKTAETELPEISEHPVPSTLTIVSKDNTSESVDIKDFVKMYFNDTETLIDRQSENTQILQTDDILKFVFDGISTSVMQVLNVPELNIFPNPASNFIYVSSKIEISERIDIYSLDGTLISTQLITISNGKIDIGQLASGIYILKSNNQVAKFIKQ